MKTCLIGHVAKSTGATFCIPKTISLNRPSIDRITTMALSLLAPDYDLVHDLPVGAQARRRVGGEAVVVQ